MQREGTYIVRRHRQDACDGMHMHMHTHCKNLQDGQHGPWLDDSIVVRSRARYWPTAWVAQAVERVSTSQAVPPCPADEAEVCPCLEVVTFRRERCPGDGSHVSGGISGVRVPTMLCAGYLELVVLRSCRLELTAVTAYRQWCDL